LSISSTFLSVRSLPLSARYLRFVARSRPWVLWVAAVLAYTAFRPLVGLGHELGVLLVASGLRACVATGFWQPLVARLGLDPIYTGAAIRAAGGVKVVGLAVAKPLGVGLHALLPQVFLAPELATPGAGVSMVAAPGAPALGHGLAAFGADVAWLTLGSWLFWRWRRRRWPVALIGLLIDAQIAVNHLLDAQVSLHELEASGLPFALALALPGDGTWFTARLAEALNQDWDYSDPRVREQILERVSAWVERYKDHPAVRMWAPGNEDLHRILYPNWVSKENDPVARARADAFAAFVPVLVDRIHALDPDHPVIYRDAEDVYLWRLKAAFEQTGVDRPWLVYGANVYAARRLQEIVSAWPAQWISGPLVISEFAPGGVGPAERPLGFQLDWTTLRQRPEAVLGGLAYTWATNGPEQLDRVFGLVDPRGAPVDEALAALSSLYQADQAAAQQPGPS
jgi:Glycosyl hydrolases family 2, TIM barrel domain